MGQVATDSSSKPTGLAPSVDYPHSDSFKKTSSHGIQYQKDSFVCAKCHGADFSGGNAKVACSSCHASFPHPNGWSKLPTHGQGFTGSTETQKKQCLSCHAKDNGTQNIHIPQCVSCHKAYPHDYPKDEKFRSGKGKHKEYATSGDGKCVACHRNYKENMPNHSAGCQDCHAGKFEISWKSIPHDNGWPKPQVHGKTFASLADGDRKACMKCHSQMSTDPANTAQTPACVECHKAYPHDSAGDADDFKGGGGQHPILAKTYEGKCTLCHRNYKDNMPTSTDGCIDCHEGGVEAGWKAPATSFNHRARKRIPTSTKK